MPDTNPTTTPIHLGELVLILGFLAQTITLTVFVLKLGKAWGEFTKTVQTILVNQDDQKATMAHHIDQDQENFTAVREDIRKLDVKIAAAASHRGGGGHNA